MPATPWQVLKGGGGPGSRGGKPKEEKASAYPNGYIKVRNGELFRATALKTDPSKSRWIKVKAAEIAEATRQLQQQGDNDRGHENDDDTDNTDGDYTHSSSYSSYSLPSPSSVGKYYASNHYSSAHPPPTQSRPYSQPTPLSYSPYHHQQQQQHEQPPYYQSPHTQQQLSQPPPPPQQPVLPSSGQQIFEILEQKRHAPPKSMVPPPPLTFQPPSLPPPPPPPPPPPSIPEGPLKVLYYNPTSGVTYDSEMDVVMTS